MGIPAATYGMKFLAEGKARIMTSKKLETVLISAGRKPAFTQGSVNPVIQRASSLVFDSVQNKKKATAYGRRGTMTHFSL